MNAKTEQQSPLAIICLEKNVALYGLNDPLWNESRICVFRNFQFYKVTITTEGVAQSNLQRN